MWEENTEVNQTNLFLVISSKYTKIPQNTRTAKNNCTIDSIIRTKGPRADVSNPSNGF
jgi:hypothetical protein